MMRLFMLHISQGSRACERQQEKEDDIARERDHEEHVLEMEQLQDYEMDMGMGM